MTSRKFDKVFGGPPRKPESELTQREMDLAASVQAVTEEVVIKLAKSIAKSTGQKTSASQVALHSIVLPMVNCCEQRFSTIFGFSLQRAMQEVPLVLH